MGVNSALGSWQAKNSPEELRRSEPERAFGLGVSELQVLNRVLGLSTCWPVHDYRPYKARIVTLWCGLDQWERASFGFFLGSMCPFAMIIYIYIYGSRSKLPVLKLSKGRF